ncbi:MAG: alpha/beta hydrolase family protein [Nocardioidaceae bacterium]
METLAAALPAVVDRVAPDSDRHGLAATTAALVGLGPLGAASATAATGTATATGGSNTVAPASGATRVADVAISFRVRNVNRSKVPCASDGKTYTVRGHMVGPAAKVHSPRVDEMTLYLHGLSFGQFFWHFQGARGFDYAANQARNGQVSVVIDRLGYGSSGKPNGFAICVGSRADIAHQMIMDLRSGRYQLVSGGQAPRFSKIVLAGHSYGGQIAQVEAYSFGDIDGLIVVSNADRVQSALLQKNAEYAAHVCANGGRRVGGTGPGGYAPFGPSSEAPAALFHSARLLTVVNDWLHQHISRS